MNIYIDNNILIDHEQKKRLLPTGQVYSYFYSYVHLQELMESPRFNDLMKSRVKTIMDLTDCKSCQNDDNWNVVFDNMDPRKYLVVIQQNPFNRLIQQSIREANMHWFDGKDPDAIMKYYGIEKSRINNYTPEELMNEYRGFIEYYVTNTDDGMVMAAFQSFFNAMDMLGFWQDKRTERSNMARSYDTNHAYFASACDYFITNDRRTCNKANVLYYYYGMKTKAILFAEFIKIAKDIQV